MKDRNEVYAPTDTENSEGLIAGTDIGEWLDEGRRKDIGDYTTDKKCTVGKELSSK